MRDLGMLRPTLDADDTWTPVLPQTVSLPQLVGARAAAQDALLTEVFAASRTSVDRQPH